jgi:4a-hydroxytetrahydrobiopterin dehydratase
MPPSPAATAAPPSPITEKLKAERIQLLARALPRWRVAPGGREIRRTWQVPGLWAGTALAGAVAAVVERRGHTAAITVTPDAVAVDLTTPSAGGLTARDFEVATALEFGA